MKKKPFSKVFETTEEMDKYLEESDLSEDMKKGKLVVKEPVMQKINLDLPASLVKQIDAVAQKIGVSRQPLLKIWIHERLKSEENS